MEKSEKKRLRALARNRRFYAFFRVVLGPFFKNWLHWNCEPYVPKDNTFLVLSNHNHDLDACLIVLALKRHMRCVCNDHVLRLGLPGKLLVFAVDPIFKRKGAKSDETVKAIEESLHRGVSVGMQVEGNKSFNGQTGFISARTGQMVKEAAGSLITFRIEGGYLQSPRWARKKRKGPVWGRVVREYAREELNAMTAEEINERIRADLHVNAFAQQRVRPHRYRGKCLAEHLETALYVCPKCKKPDGLASKGDELHCSCGYAVTCNEYGFFEGEDVLFDNVYDWDMWQRTAWAEYIEQFRNKSATPITQDGEQVIFRVVDGKKIRCTKAGTLALYYDRMVLRWEDTEITYAWQEVSSMAILLKMTLLMTAGGQYYQIKSKKVRSALKYFAAYRYLTHQDYV